MPGLLILYSYFLENILHKLVDNILYAKKFRPPCFYQEYWYQRT